MKRPVTPELRRYLVDLIREERSLEHLYRISHSAEELETVRAEWKAAYRDIRNILVLEDIRISTTPPRPPASEQLLIIPAASR